MSAIEVKTVDERSLKVAWWSGVAAIAVVFVAHLLHSGIPGATASPAELSAFYRTHTARSVVAADLIGIGAGFFLVFAAAVREQLRRDGERGIASSLVLAGAVLFAGGLTLTAALGYVLGHDPGRFSPAAIQALHALFYDAATPIDVGAAVFLGAAGYAILRAHRLPRWLGWFALVVAALSLAPSPIGDFGALLGMPLWIIATTVALLTGRERVLATRTAGDGLGRATSQPAATR
jgi:hypothetical protein